MSRSGVEGVGARCIIVARVSYTLGKFSDKANQGFCDVVIGVKNSNVSSQTIPVASQFPGLEYNRGRVFGVETFLGIFRHEIPYFLHARFP